MRDGGNGVDVGDIAVGVAQRLQIDGLGVGLDGVLHFGQIVSVDKGGGHAELGQSVLQQVVAAAVDEKGLFGRCIEAVEEVLRTRFPGDESPFYDGGKYVLRSLEYYGGEKIPVERINYRPSYMTGPLAANFDGISSYESCITDVLSESFRGEGPEHPISALERKYGFKGAPENEACQFATVLAQYIAIYGSEDDDSDKEYGAPGGYAGETIDTMEDLFVNFIGALTFSIIGYFYVRSRGKGKFAKRFIPVANNSTPMAEESAPETGKDPGAQK